jgi:hypothetical protein
MGKRGPKPTSKLKALLRRRIYLREKRQILDAEQFCSLWPVDQAIKANERAIKAERKRRREAKKAKEQSGNNT